MIRGITKFKCTECGNVFTGLDIEWNATAFSAPCKCPQCGSFHTMPRWSFWQKPVYRKIWESVDKSQSEQS